MYKISYDPLQRPRFPRHVDAIGDDGGEKQPKQPRARLARRERRQSPAFRLPDRYRADRRRNILLILIYIKKNQLKIFLINNRRVYIILPSPNEWNLLFNFLTPLSNIIFREKKNVRTAGLRDRFRFRYYAHNVTFYRTAVSSN